MSGLEYKKHSNRRLASENQSGFSIIELMFVLVIAGILLAVAIPSFQGMIKNNRIVSTSNSVAGALAFARTEAIKRGNSVFAGEGVGNIGYVVWFDDDDDGVRDPGEELRVWPALPTGVTITSLNGLTVYEFRGTGESTATDTITICDDRSGARGNAYRLLLSGSLSRSNVTC